MEKRLRARGERLGERGVAAMTDLDGGGGGSDARPPGGARWNWSGGEGVGVVWCVQRGSGVVL